MQSVERQVGACHTLDLRETTSQQRSTAHPDSHIKQTYDTAMNRLTCRELIVKSSAPLCADLYLASLSKGYRVSFTFGRCVQVGREVQTTWGGHPGWRVRI